MKNLFASVSLIAVLAAAAPASAEECPVTFNGGLIATCSDPQKGDAGATGPQGIQGEKGDKGDAGVAGLNGQDGKDGANGAAGLNGRDFDMDKALAINSALAMPVWLGDSETVRISGGIGFADGGETAVGATGVLRLDKNWAAFVGGAVGTEGDNFAGRAGVSVGW